MKDSLQRIKINQNFDHRQYIINTFEYTLDGKVFSIEIKIEKETEIASVSFFRVTQIPNFKFRNFNDRILNDTNTKAIFVFRKVFSAIKIVISENPDLKAVQFTAEGPIPSRLKLYERLAASWCQALQAHSTELKTKNNFTNEVSVTYKINLK